MRYHKNEVKDTINILLNIDNFYGRYSEGNGRIMIFIASTTIPFLVYTLLIMQFIPFKFFLPVFILYSFRMFLITVGREKERLESFIKQKNDEYEDSDDLIRFFNVKEDGLIEYVGGKVAYIIQGYGYSYFNDNAFSKELQEFLDKLMSEYSTDIYGQLVYNELNTSMEDLEKLSVYKDVTLQKERLEYYKFQDDYTNKNTKLYKLNFVIKGNKSEWLKMRKHVDMIVGSELTNCFDMIKVCDRQEAIDVMSRDSGLYIDIGEMLTSKHISEEFHGSKLLYLGDDVPEQYRPKKYSLDEETSRRVVKKIDDI